MGKYELYHHGILGQKWGVRRFQNEDGSLTEAGKRRYDVGSERRSRKSRLEQKYLEKGKTELEAKKAAKNRIIAERALAAIGGLSIASVTALVARKHFKEKAQEHLRHLESDKAFRLTRLRQMGVFQSDLPEHLRNI